MLARLPREALLYLLDSVHEAAAKSESVPILRHVLLTASPCHGLRAAACDTEMLAEAECPADVDGDGAATAEAAKFRALVRGLPKDADIELSFGRGLLSVRSGGFEAALPSLAADEFPALGGPDGVDGFEVEGRALAGALATVEHAAAAEEIRYYLNGVCLLGGPGRLILCATDGHRLCEVVIDAGGAPAIPEHGVIVPRRALRPLGRMASAAGEEPLALATDGKLLCAASRSGTRLVTRLVDGTFPDYRRLMPEDRTDAAIVDRARALEAVSRAMVVADRGDAVTVAFGPGALTISASTDGGSTCERVPAGFAGSELTMRFAPRYLRDMFAALPGENVDLLPGSPMAPLLVRAASAGVRYLVMPMRV